MPQPALPAAHSHDRLSPNVPALGFVSLLTALSSAMIYGLLPVFLVRVLGVSMASVGLIEGAAESANSLVKILSGATSDWIRKRKPLVIFGYTLSAMVKTLFPIAESVSTVLVARVTDRLGKGIRDAPRDAFLADLTAPGIRGTGFGLRMALAIAGFVFGPLLAVTLMRWSGDDFRLVFWVALVPAYLSIIVLVLAVNEYPSARPSGRDRTDRWRLVRRRHLAALPTAYWRAIVFAGLLSLARFSPAFLVLRAHDAGLDAAYVPVILGLMYLVYSITSYPFGVLSDRSDRRLQLAIGTVVLIVADTVLASAPTIALVAFGAILWGLQMGATQGCLGAIIADSAPDHLRGTAFGIYDVATGVTTFAASAAAGALWMGGGPGLAFGASTGVAIAAALALWLLPFHRSANVAA